MARGGKRGDVTLLPDRLQERMDRKAERRALAASGGDFRRLGKPHCVQLCDDSDIDFGRYAVNRPNVREVISQPLYDRQLYPVAGSGQLIFFQNPVGQGGKTLEDTNMTNAGQLPAPQSFMITGVSVNWWPGLTVSPAMEIEVTKAATLAGAILEMQKVFRQGVLQINIGSKNYLQIAPLDQLPCRSHFAADCALADQTTAAADLVSSVQIPYIEGDVFQITPLELIPSQNWNVTIGFPAGNVTITDALAYIGVTLWGVLKRSVQ